TFRDSQRRIALTSRNTWMAVSSDLGDPNDVHPRMKRPIGQRLALQALHHTYKHKIVSEGPVLANAKRVGSSVELTFRNDDGLACTRGFEIAGADGLFYEAEIRIGDGRVVLKSNRVKVPCAVRYAWQPYTEADLHNVQGLPASTFLVNRLK
ncbi:MAG: sialate O-acetylesterase, partial [Bacteroidaceae bacterium]|nr:sialate O-acetylesterase [Bacteroidaceae bacterium]